MVRAVLTCAVLAPVLAMTGVVGRARRAVTAWRWKRKADAIRRAAGGPRTPLGL